MVQQAGFSGVTQSQVPNVTNAKFFAIFLHADILNSDAVILPHPRAKRCTSGSKLE